MKGASGLSVAPSSFAVGAGSRQWHLAEAVSISALVVLIVESAAAAAAAAVAVSTMLVQQRCRQLSSSWSFLIPGLHGSTSCCYICGIAYQQHPCLCKASFLRPARSF